MTKSVNIPEKKTELQERAARDMLESYKDYHMAVAMDGSVEDKRKLVELQMKLTGAEADKKQDQFAGLAVFNVVFAPAGMQAQVQAVPQPEVLEVEATELATLPSPFPQPGKTREMEPVDEAALERALKADIDDLLNIPDLEC